MGFLYPVKHLVRSFLQEKHVFNLVLNTPLYFKMQIHNVEIGTSCFSSLSEVFFKKKCLNSWGITAQKMKFSIKDCFSKCDQIRRKRLLKKVTFTKEIFNGKLHFCALLDNDKMSSFRKIGFVNRSSIQRRSWQQTILCSQKDLVFSAPF